MPAGYHLFLAGLALGLMCVFASAAAKQPGGHWSYFHFDGRTFAAGRSADGTPFVALRDNARPAVLMREAKLEVVKLATGTGALVGICYIRSSGGKLKRGPAYLPCPRTRVQIFSCNKVVVTTQTDEQGYFQATLAAGKYRVGSRETLEVTVESGTTKLVPLRVGKRMVD